MIPIQAHRHVQSLLVCLSIRSENLKRGAAAPIYRSVISWSRSWRFAEISNFISRSKRREDFHAFSSPLVEKFGLGEETPQRLKFANFREFLTFFNPRCVVHMRHVQRADLTCTLLWILCKRTFASEQTGPKYRQFSPKHLKFDVLVRWQ